MSVVITGCGYVGAAGVGLDSVRTALGAAEPTLSEVEPKRYPHRARGRALCARVAPDLDFDNWLTRREARRMSPLSRMAAVAGRMALEDAGLEIKGDGRTSTVVATVFGASNFTEEILRTMRDPEAGPKFVTPFHFTDCVANAPAGQVAVAVNARGPNTTVCQREAGGAIALRRGVRDLELGRADRALVGVVDEAGELVHSTLRRFRVLADGVPHPFDQHRDGVLLAEGAGVAVLEREDAALARGATPLARVVASAQAFDPTATPASWGCGGESLAGALAALLEREGGRDGIDAVVSTAGGSRRGDALETDVLQRVFGPDSIPPLLCPKAVLGEFGGGQLVPAVAALQGVDWQGVGSQGSDRAFVADPELGVTPWRGRCEPRRILWSSLASSGAAAWIVLERPKG